MIVHGMPVEKCCTHALQELSMHDVSAALFAVNEALDPRSMTVVRCPRVLASHSEV